VAAVITLILLVVLVAGIALGILLTIEHHEEARAELDAAEQRFVASLTALVKATRHSHRTGQEPPPAREAGAEHGLAP
jgi:hypothetical protein